MELTDKQVDDIAEIVYDWWNEGSFVKFDKSTCFQYKSGFPYEVANRIKGYLAGEKVTK